MGEIPCTNTFFPSYMHSFAITDHWIVVVEQPLVVSWTFKLAHNSKFTRNPGERGGDGSGLGDKQAGLLSTQMEG